MPERSTDSVAPARGLETGPDAPCTDETTGALIARLVVGDVAAASSPPSQRRSHSELRAAMQPRTALALQRSIGNRAMSGVVQRNAAKPKAKPKVEVRIRSKEDVSTFTKAVDIGAAHGNHQAVAWTTPHFDFNQLYVSPDADHVVAVYDFWCLFELPIDYDRGAAAVVIDHEIGHKRIAERKANEILAGKAKSQIESLSTVDQSSVQDVLRTCIGELLTAEREAAQSYDAADYPLMVERYTGVRKSLAELGKASPAISAAARALRRIPGLRSAVQFGNHQQAAEICTGIGGIAMSPLELARVQYNAEFQALLAAAAVHVDEVHQNVTLLPGISPENDAVAPQVAQLKRDLGRFRFSPSGATAKY